MANKSNIPDNVTIYSIESCKGGVGKTTIAFNLAKVLSSKGKQLVLLLDCDFIGTSMSDAVDNSNYWAECVQTLKQKHGDIEEKYNLLELFINNILDVNIKVDLSLQDKKRILAIGSTSNRLSHGMRLDYLLDELHVLWYIQCIEKCILKFVKDNKREDISVIIDHSPGYGSFQSALHDWMLHVGWSKSRFLYVSSHDIQDMIACIDSISQLNAMIEECRDSESAVLSLRSKDSMSSRDREKLLSYSSGVSIPNDYKIEDNVSMIINKVPSKTTNKELQFNYKGVFDDKKYLLFCKVTHLNSQPQTLLEYDEDIHLQFFEKNIMPIATLTDRSEQEIQKSVASLLKELNNYEIKKFDTAQVQKIGEKYTEFLSVLEECHYSRLTTSLLRIEKLHPTYILKMLSNSITGLVVHTYSMGYVKAVDGNLKEFKQRSVDLLNEFVNDKQLHNEQLYMQSLWDYMFKATGSNPKEQRSPLAATLFLFLYVFLEFQKKYYDSNKSYKEFLADKDKLMKNKISFYDFLGTHIAFLTKNIETNKFIQVLDSSFCEFYKVLCYALLRMIDFKGDMEVIITNVLINVKNNAIYISKKELNILRIGIVDKTNALEQNRAIYNELQTSAMKSIETILNKLFINKSK